MVSDHTYTINVLKSITTDKIQTTNSRVDTLLRNTVKILTKKKLPSLWLNSVAFSVGVVIGASFGLHTIVRMFTYSNKLPREEEKVIKNIVLDEARDKLFTAIQIGYVPGSFKDDIRNKVEEHAKAWHRSKAELQVGIAEVTKEETEESKET